MLLIKSTLSWGNLKCFFRTRLAQGWSQPLTASQPEESELGAPPRADFSLRRRQRQAPVQLGQRPNMQPSEQRQGGSGMSSTGSEAPIIRTWFSIFKTRISSRSLVTLVQMQMRRQLGLDWEEGGLWSLTWFGFQSISPDLISQVMAFGQFLTHSMTLTAQEGSESAWYVHIAGVCTHYTNTNHDFLLELDCCKIQSPAHESGCFNIDVRLIITQSDKIKKCFCFRHDPYYQGKKGKGGCGEECECRPFTRSHFTAVWALHSLR